MLALNAWRPDRLWLAFGAGLVVNAIADSWYLAELAKGTYAEGGVLDLLWPASTLLIAWAAWQPRRPAREPGLDGLRMIVVPAGFALVGLAVLVYDHFDRQTGVAVALAAGTLVAAVARMGVTFVANVRMLAASRREAVTDALTWLRNRRSLMLDLEDS